MKGSMENLENCLTVFGVFVKTNNPAVWAEFYMGLQRFWMNQHCEKLPWVFAPPVLITTTDTPLTSPIKEDEVF